MRDSLDTRYWVTWAGAALRRPGMTDTAAIADATGIAERTVRNWKHTNRAPAWALRVLMQVVTGLPTFATNWHGWRFKPAPGGAVLGGPQGQEWTPADLERHGELYARVRTLENAVAPGSQLRWEAPGTGARNVWPGGSLPTWLQLEDALRHVIRDEHHRDRLGS